MGYGDEIMATGLARGACERGKRIAFGDGRRIIRGPWCDQIFRFNPNVAPPGSERDPDIEWVAFYKGNRIYNRLEKGRWIWNMAFKPIPGEIVFDDQEEEIAALLPPDVILIEPNVPQNKSVAVNKQWPLERWQRVADALLADGFNVVQLSYSGMRYRLEGVDFWTTKEFRHALIAMSRARLFIGHEGGLHHAAAAFLVPAVVIFGGFIPPQVTGYDFHINLVGDALACGSLFDCQHCKRALDNITVDQVIDAAKMLFVKQKVFQ